MQLKSVNSVTLIGALKDDIEIKSFNGSSIGKFCCITTEGFKDTKSGEWKTNKDFISCQQWNPSENYMKTFKKGDVIYVSGNFKTTKTRDGKFFSFVNVKEITKLVVLDGSETSQPQVPKSPYDDCGSDYDDSDPF